MKYGKEFELQVGQVTMRGIEAWGTEDELAKLIAVDAPAKGWSVHSQGHESVILSKPRQLGTQLEVSPKPEAAAESAEDVGKRRAELEQAEWDEGMRASAQLPAGLVVCARCDLIDRSMEMHGMARCGSPASRVSVTGRATFYGWFYARKCEDFRPRRQV